MINLLPEDCKKKVWLEFFRRFVVVAGCVFFALIIAQIILLIVLFFLTGSYEGNFSDVLRSSQKYAELRNVTVLETKIKELNNFLKVFVSGERGVGKRAVSGYVREITDNRTDFVFINSIVCDFLRTKSDRPEIYVSGQAKTRSGLLEFVENLKQSAFFKSVEFPPSNLASGSNVDFTLSLMANE